MSSTTSGTTTPADPSASPRKLKILMLHGYTQSGPLFHAKTRALEKSLSKAFPASKQSPLYPLYPGGVQLFYPTAPIKLLPADIPGYTPQEGGEEGGREESWGWWIRETGSGLYSGLSKSLEVIRESIKEVGGIDGVIGFSQGGCAASFVASLLEPGREEAFSKSTTTIQGYPEGWEELLGIGQGQLKFAVSYSGFYAPHEAYRPFYEPEINTPLLSFIGSLDSVVEEGRSTGLVERCREEARRVVYHPGGHFVPVGKDMMGVLVGFIRECCEVKKEEDEGVEDMDVPF